MSEPSQTTYLVGMKREARRYAYTIEVYTAGAGRPAWRWTVHDAQTGATLVRGVSLHSRDAADRAAAQEIARRTATI